MAVDRIIIAEVGSWQWLAGWFSFGAFDFLFDSTRWVVWPCRSPNSILLHKCRQIVLHGRVLLWLELSPPFVALIPKSAALFEVWVLVLQRHLDYDVIRLSLSRMQTESIICWNSKHPMHLLTPLVPQQLAVLFELEATWLYRYVDISWQVFVDFFNDLDQIIISFLPLYALQQVWNEEEVWDKVWRWEELARAGHIALKGPDNLLVLS